jgi:hypothetical protein
VLTVENLQIAFASLFGVIFVGAFLIIAARFPNPTTFQQTIFRVILALSAAGVAAMIPGFISVEIGAVQGLALRAGGAIAVFTLVYFFNPAERGPGPSHAVATSSAESPRLPDWAIRRDARALKDELVKLPLSQRLILSIIAKSGRALRPDDFLEHPDNKFTRREIIYMCRELDQNSFIETRDYTDKEYAISKAVSDTLGGATKRLLAALPADEQLRSNR